MRLLRRETGIALPIAMMAIVLIGIMAAVLASTSLQLNETSSLDRDEKRALAVAEAGMDTALDRLNRLLPLDSQCLADGPVNVLAQAQLFNLSGYGAVTIPASGCPPATGRAGNGGTYHYYVSPALGAGANGCNNPLGVSAGTDRASLLASGVTVLERCVTAIGVVNDGVRRIQRRAYSTLSLFHGLTVTEDDPDENALHARDGSDLLATQVTSMGRVALESVGFAGRVVRHRAAPEVSATDVSGAWTEMTTEVPSVLSGVVAPSTSDGYTCVGPPADLTCANGGIVDGVLRVAAGYSVTLTGGNYPVCGVAVTGGALLVTGTASVFVGQPSPGCNGTGTISIGGGVLNSPAGIGAASSAPSLRFYVVGRKDAVDPNAVVVNAGAASTVNALFYAPNGVVTFGGRSAADAPTVTGAVSARRVVVSDGARFAGLPNLGVTLDPANLAGTYAPGDWVECERRHQPGRPHSDCRS